MVAIRRVSNGNSKTHLVQRSTLINRVVWCKECVLSFGAYTYNINDDEGLEMITTKERRWTWTWTWTWTRRTVVEEEEEKEEKGETSPVTE
jgi:hypothetical protein